VHREHLPPTPVNKPSRGGRLPVPGLVSVPLQGQRTESAHGPASPGRGCPLHRGIVRRRRAFRKLGPARHPVLALRVDAVLQLSTGADELLREGPVGGGQAQREEGALATSGSPYQRERPLEGTNLVYHPVRPGLDGVLRVAHLGGRAHHQDPGVRVRLPQRPHQL
jgi:hypothetical protein